MSAPSPPLGPVSAGARPAETRGAEKRGAETRGAADRPGEEPGPDEALEALEIELLLTAVARRYGYDFRGYQPGTIRRRVRRAMLREEVRSPSALQDRVLHDPAALERLVSCLSVHVTGMFRDPPFYRVLRREIVPLLRTFPFARIWVAGCSTGEEAYSLAILLEEEGLYDRCRIYATDVSGQLLKQARQGILPLGNMRAYTTAYQRAGGKGDFGSYYEK